MPQIAVINESNATSAQIIQQMIPAFLQQWNQDLKPVWGLDQASFTFIPAGQKPASGTWWVVFLDNSDQAGALAYHDLTNEGLPISKVFAKTIADAKESLSVGASHEICEMAVDPWLNGAFQDQSGVFWAGEVCDPVEDDQYGYDIGGVLVTDFVTPNWFAHQYSTGPIDQNKKAMSAFEVLSGGYAQKFDANQGWVQITGSKARLSAAARPARGSRRDRRARQWQNWARSEHKF